MAMADFPFEVVKTSGEVALAAWEDLKKSGRGTPVVLGDKIEDFLPACNPVQAARLPLVRDILAEAKSINFPDDLLRFRREEFARAMAVLSKTNPSISIELDEEEYVPPLGDWPAEASELTWLIGIVRFRGQKNSIECKDRADPNR